MILSARDALRGVPRMSRPITAIAVALALVLAASAAADPPQMKNITPYGAQRGVATELVIDGSNVAGGNIEFVAPFKFTADALGKSEAGTWRPKITVAPDVPLGVYVVRVRTDEGLSNPMLFSVGQLPQIKEKEDNNTPETAQEIPSPVVVEGQAGGNDVDYFRFHGRKGQRIVVDAQCSRIGSGVDPSIRLTTVGGKYVASADDSPSLLTDARLTTVLPEDTDYVVELSDSRYQGGERPIYRLVVGPVPVAEEVFPLGGRAGETVGFELRGGTMPGVCVAAATLPKSPNDDLTQIRVTNYALGLAGPGDPMLEVESMPPVAISSVPEVREPSDPNAPPVATAVPVILNGRIDPAGDEDRFVLEVTPGKRYRAHVIAADLDSALDGQLTVLGAKNAVIASADDTNLPPLVATKKANQQNAALTTPDPSVDFTAPAGVNEVTLVLRDLERRGGVGFPYRISVEPVFPTFELRLDDAQASIPKGGSVALDLTVTRKGYNGPITVDVPNLPKGLTVRKGQIAEGQLLGVVTLTAAPDASFGVVHLDVVGEGKGADGPIIVKATKPLIFAQQANLPTNVVWQTGVPAAPASPEPLVFETPSEPVEVPHGGEAKVLVRVVRPSGAESAIDLATLPLPPGLTATAAKIIEKTSEAKVTIACAPETALGGITIAVTAKGKFDNKNWNFVAPGITLNVVRPVALDPGATAIEVKAGTTYELKGKIVRKGSFNEPVTIKLNGVPAGLKVEAVTLASDASDYIIRIAADPSAAAATATVQLAAAFQLNKKDYPAPTTPIQLKVLPAK
jgi:hypothetical protein